MNNTIINPCKHNLETGMCVYCKVERLKAEIKRLRDALEFIEEQFKPENGSELDERIGAVISRIKKSLKPTTQKEGD